MVVGVEAWLEALKVQFNMLNMSLVKLPLCTATVTHHFLLKL